MKRLPDTDNALMLRTDFSNDESWEALCGAVREPRGEFRAYVDYVSDPQYDGLTPEQLIALPSGSYRSFMFVADQVALSHPDHPILVIDVGDQPGRTFRVIPSEVWGVENSLSIANMDFAEFAEAVDRDGVFRGFPMG